MDIGNLFFGIIKKKNCKYKSKGKKIETQIEHTITKNPFSPNRDVHHDVTGLRIYLSGWQEIKNFYCLSMKAQL